MNLQRESIFSRSIRSFFTSFAIILGIVFGIGVVLMSFSLILGPNYLPPRTEPTIAPDAKGDRFLLSAYTPVILRINLHGVIGMGDLTTEKIENLLLDSRDGFLKGDRVKGLFLHINSPGGTVSDSDGIYRAFLNYKTKYKVPLYAYVDGLCASGGIYIACAADKIYATSSSVIGSVGVLMGPTFNFSEAMNKVGVSSLTLTEGKDKDALNPFRPWAPDEGSLLKEAITRPLYEHFVAIVEKSRPKLTKAKLVNDYGAHIFIAKEAQELGYIDIAGSDYSEALEGLTKAANLSDLYQVIQLKLKHSIFDDIAQNYLLKNILQWTGITPSLENDLRGKPLYLYRP